MLNKCVFNWRLKTFSDWAARSSSGNVFQSLGATTLKDCSPTHFPSYRLA